MEMPLRMPKPITVRESNGFCSNSCIHLAICSEQKVTIKCQLVNVVAGSQETALVSFQQGYIATKSQNP
jgi:hypothetical protein